MTMDPSGVPQAPPLTRLQIVVHNLDSGARTLEVSFLLDVRQTLSPEFEAMAHNAVLAWAHRGGHMPVGPILITTTTWDPDAERAALKEGGKLRAVSLDEMALEAQAKEGNIVLVKGECELGLSLL